MDRAKHYLSLKRPRKSETIPLGLVLHPPQGSRTEGEPTHLSLLILLSRSDFRPSQRESRRERTTTLMIRVEITGPTDRKMVINALNSGAKTFMADLEGEFFLPGWRVIG
jgi:hypothetical protein